MTHLEFLNKNLYRRYPFQKTALVGSAVSNACFVAMRVSQPDATLVKFYFKCLSYVNGVFYGNLYGVNASDDEFLLGSFSDKITSEGQVLKFKSFGDRKCAGNLTVGLLSAFEENFYSELDVTSGGIEPTCVVFYAAPLVTQLVVHPKYNGNDTIVGDVTAKVLTGDVVVVPSGITTETTIDVVEVSVVNFEQILGKGNKSLCAGNCSSPVIYAINTVSPDISGNIDIVGVSPVAITMDAPSGTLTITTPTISRDILCQGSTPNTPPNDTSNTYYTDIATALKTEWQTWPQYQ